MAYTVRKLLESEQFPKMKLLCGEKGLYREVEQHFEDLVKSDISGFSVKKREEDDPTGKRLKLLEKHCEKYEIPLLEIPEDLYYWGIIRYVMTQVFDKDTARFLFQSMSLCTEQRKERKVSTYAAYKYKGLCERDLN